MRKTILPPTESRLADQRSPSCVYLSRRQRGCCLTEDLHTSIPRYAILSHRWGTDEVTLQELNDGAGPSKRGYHKIHFCSEQARRDGLSHFWVDTCCIDKTNAVELQEAINSMYRWYRNADRCYVYLDDVSCATGQATSQAHQPSWYELFRKSDWFTRGWTLRELLAPSSVGVLFEGRHLSRG